MKDFLIKVGLFYKGYYLFVDNFYISFIFVEFFFGKEIFLIGIMYVNRKGIFILFKKVKFKEKECYYFRKGFFFVFFWREKNVEFFFDVEYRYISRYG